MAPPSTSAERLRPRVLALIAATAGLVMATAASTTSIAEWGRSAPVADERTPLPPPAEPPAKQLNTGRDDARRAPVRAVSTAGLQYVAISPYRTLDSRALGPDGDMFAGREVWFDVWTDAGGNPQIPSDIKAVSYNLTVTDTFGAGGYLALYPADRVWPGNSSINWFGTGLDLANGGIVAVGDYDGPGEVAVYAGFVPGTATYFIMDITGYYI